MTTIRQAIPSVLFFGLATAALASQPPAFDGIWSLDRGRSTALPPGMEQTMTITAEGDGFRVETAIVTDFTDRIQQDRYEFDGAEHEASAPGFGKGTRAATRVSDREFKSVDHVKGPSGDATIERAWSLDAGKDEMLIDLTTETAGGRTQSHRVFTRGKREGAAPAEASRMFPVDVSIPAAPSPFRQDGKLVLAYEVALHSFRSGEIEWRRLDVLDDSGRTLASYEGDTLAGMLARPGAAPGLEQPRRIAGGMTAVAYVWIALDGAAPGALRHRVTLSLPSAGSGALRVVDSGSSPVGPPAPAIGPPARGRGWVARWISNDSFHRRGLFPVDGRAEIAQRFAIDWNRYDDNGVEQDGDIGKNETYSVYGQEVIAVADATVFKMIDGVPQNSPPNIAPGVGFDPEKALGNCVVLALPGGIFATYAHLQPGSLKVKTGNHVKRGQLLGLVGNSGNATGPHLHFHLAKGPGLSGEGVPYVIDTFAQIGAEVIHDGSPSWKPGTPAVAKRAEMPAEHSVVAFQ